MNGLTILGIAIIVLVAAYLIYGRFLVKTWGIDMNAETPAVTKEDGVDYVPTSKWVVFTHQFSSIAGAGPVTGPIKILVHYMLLLRIRENLSEALSNNISVERAESYSFVFAGYSLYL